MTAAPTHILTMQPNNSLGELLPELTIVEGSSSGLAQMSTTQQPTRISTNECKPKTYMHVCVNVNVHVHVHVYDVYVHMCMSMYRNTYTKDRYV